MENAGRHIAKAVAARVEAGPVAILIGAGNNGGDGSVAARHLAGWGYQPTLYLACPPASPTGDARIMLDAARAAGVPISSVAALPDRPRIVVDGLLGTGLSGAVRGDAAAAIIGRLRVDTRLTLQGEMVFIEESDDLVVDRIENGQWTGVIRTSDDEGPPFDGTFAGDMDGAPQMMGVEE